MAELKGKIENVLNENRILVLGVQVLIGFEFRSAFEPRFDRLSLPLQYLNLAVLVAMLIALALVMLPAAYHRIVEGGKISERFHRLGTRSVELALFPFACGLGSVMYLASVLAGQSVSPWLIGGAAALVALLLWYGLEFFLRLRLRKQLGRRWNMDAMPEEPKLEEKVREVLVEARIVLPGAQALLGFQFVTMFLDDFDRLSPASKGLHLASLAAVALCTILLMSPAAYHRIVDNGEDSEGFLRFASRMVLVALVFLALGISGEFYIVVQRVSHSVAAARVAAIVSLAVFYGLWFGYTGWKRMRLQSRAG